MPLNSSGNVSAEAALAAYNNTVTIMSDHFNSISDTTNKHPALLDMKLLSSAGGVSTSVNYQVTSVIANGDASSLCDDIDDPFEDDDDWTWGFNEGKCDGTEKPGDAANVLQFWTNRKCGISPVIERKYHYFVSVDEVMVYETLNPDDDVLCDNYRDFYPYRTESTCANYFASACISDSDMDWYLDKYSSDIVDYFAPEYLVNGNLEDKTFINTEITSNASLCGPGCSSRFHEMLNYYGVDLNRAISPAKGF